MLNRLMIPRSIKNHNLLAKLFELLEEFDIGLALEIVGEIS